MFLKKNLTGLLITSRPIIADVAAELWKKNILLVSVLKHHKNHKWKIKTNIKNHRNKHHNGLFRTHDYRSKANGFGEKPKYNVEIISSFISNKSTSQ